MIISHDKYQSFIIAKQMSVQRRLLLFLSVCQSHYDVGAWLSEYNSLLQELKDYPVYPDPSLKAFEGATLRYASLKLK